MAEAKVIIKAENNLKAGIESAKKDLNSLSNSVSNAGKKISTALNLAAVTAGITALSKAISSCVKNFNEADRKYKQLSISFSNTSSFDKATDTINKLRKMTLSGKDEIESMVAELAALGKTDEELDKVATAAVNLSNVTGRDLTSSMTTLLNTYAGNTAQLKRLGIETSNFTKEELAAGAAVDLINSKFGELSKEMAEGDFSQSIKNIKDNFGDIGQSVGDLVVFLSKDLVKALDDISEIINEKFGNFIQNVKLIIPALPALLSKVGETLKSMFTNLISVEGISSLIGALYDVAMILATDIATALSNAGELVAGLWQLETEAVGKYILYWASYACEQIGLDTSGLLNEITGWLSESGLGKVVNSLISSIINKVREMISVFLSIPDYIGAIFGYLRDSSDGFFNDIVRITKELFATEVQIIGSIISHLNLGQIVENVKVFFKNLFGSIGVWFINLKDNIVNGLKVIWEHIKATFSWDTLKAVFSNIGVWLVNLKDNFVNVFKYIGEVMKATFSWDNLKNTATHMVESFVNFFIDKINAVIAKLPKMLKIDQIERLNLTKGTSSDALSNVSQFKWKSLTENTTSIDPYKDISSSITEANKEFVKVLPEKIESAVGKSLLEFGSKIFDTIEDRNEDIESLDDRIAKISKRIVDSTSGPNAFNMVQKLVSFSGKSSADYLAEASEAFTSVADFVAKWSVNTFGGSSSSISEILDAVGDFGTEVFGNDIGKFAEWFDKFLKELQASNDIQTKSEKVSETGFEEVKSQIVEVGKFDSNESWYDSLKKNLFGYTQSVTTPDGEGGYKTEDQFVSGILNSMGIEEADYLSGTFDGLVESLGIFADMITGVNPLLAVLKPIIEGFVEVMGPMIEAVIAPLQNALTKIGQLLASIFAPVLDAIYPIFVSMANILMKVIQPVLMIIQAPLTLIATLLTILEPILEIVTEAFNFLLVPIRAVAATLQWLAAWIKFIFLSLYNAISWIWGGTKENNVPSSWSEYYEQSGLSASTDSLDLGEGVATAIAEGLSTSTAVTNASYTGSGSLTQNIYIQAPLVGSDGMEEFARMLRQEMADLGYYGVAS